MEELIRLLNIPEGIVELVKTSDGFYMGRAIGDIGANVWLGVPSFHDGPGRDRSRATWRSMSYRERRRGLRMARRFDVRLREMFGGDPYGR